MITSNDGNHFSKVSRKPVITVVLHGWTDLELTMRVKV